MSAAILIGMTDTIMNGHRPTQFAGLGGAFAMAVMVNPAVGLAAGMVAMGVARLIGRSDGQEFDSFSAVVGNAPQALERPAITHLRSDPAAHNKLEP